MPHAHDDDEFLLEVWAERERRLGLSSAPWKTVRTGPLLRFFLMCDIVKKALAERFYPETICLAVQIIDRFIQKKKLDAPTRRDLNLVGFTSLWIAMKYEEVDFLHASDIVAMASETRRGTPFTIADMVRMESEILHALEFRIASSVTFFPFLMSLIRRTASDIGIETTAWKSILSNLAYVDTPPSLVAACLLFKARSGQWDDVCVGATGGLTAETIGPIADRLLPTDRDRGSDYAIR